tara:strand:+ start:756 stop:1280 length:525 start_codon:yes stop_codon:yes gene_type:complete
MIVNNHHLKTPVTITEVKLGIPNDYKLKCIDEIYKLGDSQDQTTNVKAIMTSYFLWNESKIFDRLLGNIENLVNKLNKPFNPTKEYKVVEAWGSIYKEGHYALPHDHGLFSMSFVYYLKSNGSTPLIFDEVGFQADAKDDMLIIFPSYLIHSVPIHNGKEDRVCIAGNITYTED